MDLHLPAGFIEPLEQLTGEIGHDAAAQLWVLEEEVLDFGA